MKDKPKKTPMTSEGIASRQAAVAWISAVMEEKLPIDEAFVRCAGKLSAQDRGFVHALGMVLLRHWGQVDTLIKRYCERPVPAKMREVETALRLGIAEKLLLEHPAHAVVHSWVEVVKSGKGRGLQGMVNAILRRMVREEAVLPEFEAEKHVPRWLAKRWKEQYGEGAASILAVCRQVPPLDITVKDEVVSWAAALQGQPLTAQTVRVREAGDVTRLPGYEEGAWWVQDVAATLPVNLLREVKGKQVLDVCAAPGGKTAQLVARGAEVTALDRSEPRMGRLRQNMKRLGFAGVKDVVADALTWHAAQSYDAIVVDAPCSATGTLRRHPELVWQKGEKDIGELVALQEKVLRRAAAWVKVGGTLLYCTCSLEKEEGEERIAAFLAEMPGYALDAVKPEELPEGLGQAVTAEGMVRVLPSFWAEQGGMDGFFIARLQRRG